jgi:hypothetical protein
VSREDQFVCASAVDVPKLLRACRSTLLDQARTIGANVLVEEQYVIARRPPILAYHHSSQVVHHHHPSKNRAGGPYKVQVSSRRNSDYFNVAC